MRPVVQRGRQPDWSPKDFGGEEESLYAKWSRTCWRRQFDLHELHRGLEGVRNFQLDLVSWCDDTTQAIPD